MPKKNPEPPMYAAYRARRKRAEEGVIVVTGRPVSERTMARVKELLSPYEPDLQNTALEGWEVFEVEIPPGSSTGSHRHQGGIAIFILEGRGYTVIEGKQFDWKAGDLLLLPLKPGGIEHQHFNADSERPARYLPFLFEPLLTLGGHLDSEQTGTRPRQELRRIGIIA